MIGKWYGTEVQTQDHGDLLSRELCTTGCQVYLNVRNKVKAYNLWWRLSVLWVSVVSDTLQEAHLLNRIDVL